MTPQLLPMPPDTPLDQWTFIIGFAMPIIVAGIVQSHWPARAKAPAAFLLCVVAAAIQLWIKGQLDLSNLSTSALAIAALSITFFHGFWKPIGAAPAFEKVTDVTPTPSESQDTQS